MRIRVTESYSDLTEEFECSETPKVLGSGALVIYDKDKKILGMFMKWDSWRVIEEPEELYVPTMSVEEAELIVAAWEKYIKEDPDSDNIPTPERILAARGVIVRQHD